ncbi:hypothetical protein BBJ28_00017241, partial [Nothophytophthora sp. Chile5]
SSDDGSGLRRVNASPARELVPKVETSRAPDLPPGITSSSSAAVVGPTKWQLVVALYHWTTCLFIVVLVAAQFLSFFWNSVSSTGNVLYGKYPSAGAMMEIVGTNDKPVTDRLLACVLEGRFYKPVLLNDILDTAGATVIPASTEPQVNGYRVVRRREVEALSSDAYATFSDTCALLANTMDSILDTCDQNLGYNVTRDELRIVVDGEKANVSSSDTVQLIADSLPIVVMPYWDNAPFARYAVPGWDGSACMFRLTGKYIDASLTDSFPSMLAVNRSVREAKTREWLDAPDGKWRHGWLHVGTGTEADVAYFSDAISTDPQSDVELRHREFNTVTRIELDCVNEPDACLEVPISQTWGEKLSFEEHILTMTSITIATAQHTGFFLYDSHYRSTVRSVYDWETLIANVALALLLLRWIVAMLALHRGFWQGRSGWHSGGLGCVAGSRSFNLLPIVLLPHLKVTLAAFWTAGCLFEGDQSALSESWFTVYPALAEFTLVYYSILNIATKIGRRRITDALFAPTLALLCILHRCRGALASYGWLPGVDGRVTTRVGSAEIQDLRLVDFFISDIVRAARGQPAAAYIPPTKQPDTGLKGVERALAIRASNVGGLGCSPVYLFQSTDGAIDHGGKPGEPKPEPVKVALNSYELVRLGYVVYGGRFLLTFDAWDVIFNTVPLRRVHHLWNYRVVLFPLRDQDGYAAVSEKPVVCRLDDVRLDGISFWSIAAQPVKC